MRRVAAVAALAAAFAAGCVAQSLTHSTPPPPLDPTLECVKTSQKAAELARRLDQHAHALEQLVLEAGNGCTRDSLIR